MIKIQKRGGGNIIGRKIKPFIYDKETSDFITSLYSQHKIKMLKFAFSILNDWHDSEDAVEEAFISLSRNAKKIIHSECFEIRAYMINTVRNASLKILNKKMKVQCTDINEIEKYAECCESAEDTAISSISYEDMEKMVENLNPKYKILLNMKYNMVCSNKEIATELEVTEDSVRSMLSRLRSFLRKEISGGEYNEKGHI